MTCTDCKRKANTRIGAYWTTEHGYIIKKDESLCYTCANKRKGFKTLTELAKERRKENEAM